MMFENLPDRALHVAACPVRPAEEAPAGLVTPHRSRGIAPDEWAALCGPCRLGRSAGWMLRETRRHACQRCEGCACTHPAPQTAGLYRAGEGE
jgi:hypothetical protein